MFCSCLYGYILCHKPPIVVVVVAKVQSRKRATSATGAPTTIAFNTANNISHINRPARLDRIIIDLSPDGADVLCERVMICHDIARARSRSLATTAELMALADG